VFFYPAPTTSSNLSSARGLPSYLFTSVDAVVSRPSLLHRTHPSVRSQFTSLEIMGHSLRGHTSMTSMAPRPQTRDTNRPATREQTVDNGMIPSRTSSLHSRITQPLPTTLAKSNNRPTPKTLTHAYMVCGVGREPSQWVKAPLPSHGKIQHMKGAVGQFWLPEILGSSPRLETDNEIARALHSAMRVCVVARSIGKPRL
jgi:hypothetical protein